MSTKPESTFIASIHKLVPPAVYRVKMNNPYTAGIPDVWYSGTGGDLWVEYKWVPKLPSKADVDPLKLLSALQVLWLDQRRQEGRHVAVIIGSPIGCRILTDGTWHCPQPVTTFTLSRKEAAVWITHGVNSHAESSAAAAAGRHDLQDPDLAGPDSSGQPKRKPRRTPALVSET